MEAAAPRIGVFFCDCGETTNTILDFKKLKAYAKELVGVVYVEEDKFLCHAESTARLGEMIKKHSLDRIVIAACSPRIYLDEFRAAAQKAGINPYMVEQTNLREQVAWIHSDQAPTATEKARDMLAMSVARTRKMDPLSTGPGAKVREDLCSGCGVCASTCRQGCISFVETKPGHRVAQVDRKECKACGACVAACPSGAMNLEGFTNEEVIAEIDEFSKGLLESKKPFPAILIFACNWCSYPAADLAGLKRLQIDAHFRLIKTPCSARVDPEWVLRALSRGVDGVMVLGGKEGSCHFKGGNVRTRNRMALLTKMIEQLGFDTERFEVQWVNEDEAELFKSVVDGFIAKIEEIGPNPMRDVAPEDQMTSALRHGRDEVVHPAYNFYYGGE